MQCQCGAQILGGAFCTNCGRPIVAQQPPQPQYVQMNPMNPMNPMNQNSNSNVFSIVALSLGGTSLLLLPILFGPAAIGFAIAAMSKKEKLSGVALGVAIGGTVLGMILGYIFWSPFFY